MITRLKIQPLLAGIISMTGLYSINLVVLGQANVSYTGFYTIRSMLSGMGLPRNLDTLLVGLFVCLILLLLLSAFFRTQAGQALVATGDNAVMARSIGINTDEMKMMGFMLANGFVAISGNLVAQDNGFADIGMGVGTVVLGLAAVILGEVMIRHVQLSERLAAIIPGAVLYRLLLLFVLQLRFDPQLFKLFSALILALCLGIPSVHAQLLGRHRHRGLLPKEHHSGSAFESAVAERETTTKRETAEEPETERRTVWQNTQDGETLSEEPSAVPRLVLDAVDKTFVSGGEQDVHALNGMSLTVERGDFITVIGTNGAGKSTLLNAIAGQFVPDSGTIALDGEILNHQSESERAGSIARIFQDPKMGTAPRMTVAENLSLAAHRGETRTLHAALSEDERATFAALLKDMGLGLETRLDTEISLLSGGQRQAVSLLMATLKRPKVLLLDEHTAALDAKTARTILALTKKTVEENKLTALMITHNLEDALRYGNRMILLKDGRILRSFDAEEKAAMQPVGVFRLLAEMEEDAAEEAEADKNEAPADEAAQ